MTASSPPTSIPIVSSIAPLAAGRRAWLVDIWGVMHNGVRPFLPAANACRAFREAGGTVLLLSNAPRPSAPVIGQLDRIGVPREAYDGLLTSGDAARDLIVEAVARGRALGHLGPERDLGLYDGLGATMGPLEAAQTVVCTGLFDDTFETPDHYAAVLARLAQNGADMICANPDLTVERGGQIIYCAGALAAAYAALGGTVAYAGKPYPPVYRLARERLAAIAGRPMTNADILAIGDGVLTDVSGATAAGLDAVYIASGVHLGPGGRLDAATLEAAFRGAPGRPIAAMPELAW